MSKLHLFGNVFEYCKKSGFPAGLGSENGVYPFFTSSDKLSKKIDSFIYEIPSLIFGTGGKASVHYCDVKFNTSNDCIVANPKNIKETFPKFIYYYLRKNFHLIENGFKGAGLKHISKDYISKLKIPLPPLSEQKRIAEILDKADSMRIKRKESISLLDEFLRSVFLGMFGDPVRNEKGWRLKNLNDCCNKITDGTHDTPKRISEGIKFITGKHIRPFKINFHNSDYVTIEEHKEIYKRCNPEFRDILYTNIGVNLGTAAMNTVNYEFSMKNVALLKNKKEIINSRFLEHLLNHEIKKNEIIRITSFGGAQQFLSLNQIKSIKILIPPLNLQTQFAQIVEQVEMTKSKMEESLKEMDNQFNGLLQKAFKG